MTVRIRAVILGPSSGGPGVALPPSFFDRLTIGSPRKHGASSAETPALKRQITALARLARETMAAIE